MKNLVKHMLIFPLFCLSAGGLMLHYRVHPFAKHDFGYVPFFAGLISVFAIPVLFEFKKTLHLAYLLNGFMSIIGVITMVHFSLVKSPIVPDILLVVSKFFIGWAIFAVSLYQLEGEAGHNGWRTIRYPNLGFWCVHLFTLSFVYWLGNTLWR